MAPALISLVDDPNRHPGGGYENKITDIGDIGVYGFRSGCFNRRTTAAALVPSKQPSSGCNSDGSDAGARAEDRGQDQLAQFRGGPCCVKRLGELNRD